MSSISDPYRREKWARIRNRWNNPGGYRQVLAVAIPLVLSTAAWSVQHFVDRMFLTWYSTDAVAAAMPAGMLHFTMVSIFMGTAGYVNTFVAQYFGANRCERIGPALWQGVYIALIGWVLIAATIPLAGPVFRLVGHAPSVQVQEVIYFQILGLGAGPFIASYALSGFFSGRGRTWPVMWVNIATTAVNLVLDYAMIFGRWGFPEMGIVGAGIATVIAGVFSLVTFIALLAIGDNNRQYRTISGWRLEPELFKRLMRFGLPSGVQFFLEIAGFTGFVLIVGRLGTIELAATNIAININTLAFMPMIGCGIAISVLVGQYVGANQPELAHKSAYSGFHLAFCYMAAIAAAYVFLPNIFIAPFAHKADPETFAQIYEYGVILLRFVALYSLFDTLNLIFTSAIKGAGDTRFVMISTVVLSVVVLIVPVYFVVVVWGGGLIVSWILLTAFVILLGGVSYARFLGGKWKHMRVIEEARAVVPPGPVKMKTAARP